MKPSDIQGLGLSIPGKNIKDLAARGGSFPIKGKFGLVSLTNYDGDDENLLVGPNYFAQARLSEKRTESESDSDDDQAEIDDINNANNREISRPNNYSEEDNEYSKENIDKIGDRQVEPVENSQSPLGFEYGNNPLFPPTYEGFYNYLPNPYLPPFNFNIPIPLINQYLQRKALNSSFRYPSFASAQQYAEGYGQNRRQYNANSPSFTPFTRYLYVQ